MDTLHFLIGSLGIFLSVAAVVAVRLILDGRKEERKLSRSWNRHKDGF